jgi:hypothetical protein
MAHLAVFQGVAKILMDRGQDQDGWIKNAVEDFTNYGR